MVCSTKKVHEEIIKDLRLYQLLINCTKCDCRNDYLYLSDLLIRVERNKSDQFCRFWAVVQSKEKVIQTKLSTKPILIIQKCDRVRDSLIVCRMGNWKTLAMAFDMPRLICFPNKAKVYAQNPGTWTRQKSIHWKQQLGLLSDSTPTISFSSHIKPALSIHEFGNARF